MVALLTRDAVRRGAIRQRQQALSTLAVSAPVGGWNARDSIDQMEGEDAVVLDNVFPGLGKVSVRNGYTQHATGVGAGDVETLAEFHGSASRKLIAAGGGDLWDATGTGAASSIGTGFTSNRWQTAMMNDLLALVNGADAAQKYDGTTLSALTISGGIGTPIGINVFKTRSFFWEDDSQSFWYSAVNTLGGALTEFPLGDVGSFGGKLVAMITWTRDGGFGLDDLAVFAMSSGEFVVYEGTDPGSAAAWNLVGIFPLGAPTNIRGAVKAGGDALVVTEDGYVALSSILPAGRLKPKERISDKIARAAQNQIRLTGTSFGWQTFIYPGRSQLLVNYPTQTTGVFEQHVLNLRTGAWCRFRGMDARCWTLHLDRPFFGGGGGIVYQADNVTNDDGGTIDWKAHQAFNYLRDRARRKQVVMVRPVLEGDGAMPVKVSVAADFRDHPKGVEPIEFGTTGSGSSWNTASWNESLWATSARQRSRWVPRSAFGYNFSVGLAGSTSGEEIAWDSTVIGYRPAGLV